jgi:hypothetical protein
MTTPSGSRFLIPVYNKDYPAFGQVSRAMYAAPAGAALPDTWLTGANLKADILWTDVDPTTKTVVESVQLKGDLNDNTMTILVTPGKDKGNALIVLFDDTDNDGYYDNTGEEIKWSWLIWNVDYSPIPEYGTGSSTTALNNAKGRWMDRNLGATINNVSGSNLPEDANVYGFLFQWGRKDPLNHAQYGINTGENFYIRNNNISSNTTVPMSADATSGTVQIWTNNPMTHYYGGEYSSGLSAVNHQLWNLSTKTVYDPCPPGWRVPPIASWTGHDLASFVNDGRTGSNFGGFYPATHTRNANNALFNTNLHGYYWSVDRYGYNSYIFYFNDVSVRDDYDASRTNGYNVRCIAI